MILLIDNYDSFTFNLFHFLGDIGEDVEVVRNDALTVPEALARRPDAIVLSPGPCDPDRAGICLDLIREGAGKVPIFGVCLGHQAIGQAFGGKVVRAPTPWHGKVDTVEHGGTDILEGVPNHFRATRYHSLVVDRETMPAVLVPTAVNGEGLVMALRHATLPLWGVQFHPESIASEHGHTILRNVMALARRQNRVPVPA
jgi:anthranilate synthase/aminodeoxychorismate synthase-like glutamine amidotransferase